MRRRTSIRATKPSPLSPLETKLIYGFHAAQTQHTPEENAGVMLWKHTETLAAQREMLKAIIEKTHEIAELIDPESSSLPPCILSIAARAAAFTKNWDLVNALYKKGAHKSDIVFGLALSGNFEVVEEIIASIREKVVNRHTRQERFYFEELTTAAAAGAALAEENHKLSTYQEQGARLFDIALACGIAENIYAFHKLTSSQKTALAQEALSKIFLIGLGIGDHYESAEIVSDTFKKNLAALELGVAIRNERDSKLSKCFKETKSSDLVLLGNLLGGHLTELPPASPDNEQQYIKLRTAALFSGRASYAAYCRCKGEVQSALTKNPPSFEALLTVLVSENLTTQAIIQTPPLSSRRNSENSQSTHSRRDSLPTPGLFKLPIGQESPQQASDFPSLPAIQKKSVRS